jgi:hypothetical protein
MSVDASPCVELCTTVDCTNERFWVTNRRTRQGGYFSSWCRDCYRRRLGFRHEIGARIVGTAGYVRIKVADGKTGGWRQEHCVVMERTLGRPLRKGESVHHKNGIRHDNRPENLELWAGAHPTGTRASDMRCPHCGELWATP